MATSAAAKPSRGRRSKVRPSITARLDGFASLAMTERLA
jgi:hypothetical protein